MNLFKYKKILSINILVFIFLTITPSIILFNYRSIKKNLVNNSESSILKIWLNISMNKIKLNSISKFY